MHQVSVKYMPQSHAEGMEM